MLVSDYMSNCDLKEYIEERNPTWNERVALARDITDGLLYLHTRAPPICHGDLKMENILVSAQLRAVLADFGLSTVMEEEGTGLTTSTGLKGTVCYYSPELILELDAKHSLFSDIWAWCCLILETLTDTVPYAQRRNNPTVLLALANKEVPASVDPLSIPSPELKALLGKCWSLDPVERPSARECFQTMSKLNDMCTSSEDPFNRRVQKFCSQRAAIRLGWRKLSAWLTFRGTISNSGTPSDPPVEDSELQQKVKYQWESGTLEPTSPLAGVNLDPLEPFFKTVQERNLIRHYVQISAALMMAIPSSLNPILRVYLPMICSGVDIPPTNPLDASILSPTSTEDSTQISTARAEDDHVSTSSSQNTQNQLAAIEALRLSLLGVAAIHQSYLLAKSGAENRVAATDMWDLAAKIRVMASKNLSITVSNVEGCRSDAALGACVSIAFIDILAGGYNYASNLDLGKSLVTIRGGPAAITRDSVAFVQGKEVSSEFEGLDHFVESSLGKHADALKSPESGTFISPGRLQMEILTVYDVFSTLTSSEQSALLPPGGTRWWIKSDQDNYHRRSVENMFGISRSLIELFARVSSFLNENRPPPEKSSGTAAAEGNPEPDLSRPQTPIVSLASLTESPPPQGSPLLSLHNQACTLVREVEAWSDEAIPMDQMHPKVKYGNYALKSALIILLLREAFNLEPTDPRVQKCAELTLLAALKASADLPMSASLTWPVIIAGCQCSGMMRVLSVRALEGFRKQRCYGVDTSEKIVTDVWRRLDGGLPRADFRSVVEDNNLRVLII